MLVEAKVKVTRVVDEKPRKRTETYLVNKDFFSEVEYDITQRMGQDEQIVESDIMSMRQSSIREVVTDYQGDTTYIATLRDIYVGDDGTEKALKYQVLLWANDLTEANTNALALVKQGYDMEVESIKEVNYKYLER